MSFISDSSLDKIRERDAKNRTLKHESGKPELAQLEVLLASYLYKRGVNNGNIYAGNLAEFLLGSGKVKMVAPAEKKKRSRPAKTYSDPFSPLNGW